MGTGLVDVGWSRCKWKDEVDRPVPVDKQGARAEYNVLLSLV